MLRCYDRLELNLKNMECSLENYGLVLGNFEDYLTEVSAQDQVKEALEGILKDIAPSSGLSSTEHTQLDDDVLSKVEHYAAWERQRAASRWNDDSEYAEFSAVPGLMQMAKAPPPEPNKPSEAEIKAYNLHQLRRQSTPGKVFLDKIKVELAIIFESVKSMELMTLQEQDGVLQKAHLCNLIVLHCINIEALLATVFSGSAEIADRLIQALDGEQVKILSHSIENKKHVYGSLCCLAISLHRNLEKNQQDVLAWLHSKFNPSLTRFESEKCNLIDKLRGKGLPQFIGRIQNKYRNARVHPAHFDFDLEGYSLFSDTCYATPTIRQWLEIGVNPRVFNFQEFGWVSALTAAAATR
jgi:hypothetical protein